MYILWMLLWPLTSLSVIADTEDIAAVVVVVAMVVTVVVTVVVISACTLQAYRRVPADKDWCSGKCYLLCSRIKLWKNDQLSSIKTTGL